MKTLRDGSNKCNTFVLKRCDDKVVYPVSGPESYYSFMKDPGISSLKTGYLLRIITESGRVLENYVSYNLSMSVSGVISSHLIFLKVNSTEHDSWVCTGYYEPFRLEI